MTHPKSWLVFLTQKVNFGSMRRQEASPQNFFISGELPHPHDFLKSIFLRMLLTKFNVRMLAANVSLWEFAKNVSLDNLWKNTKLIESMPTTDIASPSGSPVVKSPGLPTIVPSCNVLRMRERDTKQKVVISLLSPRWCITPATTCLGSKLCECFDKVNGQSTSWRICDFSIL